MSNVVFIGALQHTRVALQCGFHRRTVTICGTLKSEFYTAVIQIILLEATESTTAV